jgi:hypothetical protein
VQVFHGVRPGQSPRPRVIQGLAARLNLKRSQGIVSRKRERAVLYER